MIKNKSIIDPMDLSVEEIREIITLAEDMKKDPKKYSHVCDGKILATLFYEPSTRTRLSFETAMMRLGGKVTGFSEPNSTSVSKGETLADTIRVVSSYVDIIAMRHPLEGAAKVASMYSKVPVINAGDGGHQHPTQTLTDLLTIKNEKGTVENLTIGLCGDLKFGRTVHSLVKALSRYKNNKFVFISPKELEIPEYLIDEYLKPNNIEFVVERDLEKAITNLDVLYMTRIQKERFEDINEYNKLKGIYILNNNKLKSAKNDMIILHPLPRVDEIATEVDNDKRAKYFDQVENGMYARMALISKLLGVM